MWYWATHFGCGACDCHFPHRLGRIVEIAEITTGTFRRCGVEIIVGGGGGGEECLVKGELHARSTQGGTSILCTDEALLTTQQS